MNVAESYIWSGVAPSPSPQIAASTANDRLIATSMLATVSSVLPAFLSGALSVQTRSEFAVTESRYGWALSSYFLAAALGVAAMGRLTQRFGARRQLVTALLFIIFIQLGLAARATSFGQFVALLAICGLSNAAIQTAVNLALADAELPRLGFAIALKQSSMPTATLIGGLAVPLLALTVGWRWAYVTSAGLGLVALGAVWCVVPEATSANPARASIDARPVSSRVDLLVAVGFGFFLSVSAGTLNGWLVESGVNAGLTEGLAGLMLAVGAAAGVSLRLWLGSKLDTMTVAPLRFAGRMLFVGVVGFALLAIRTPLSHVVATTLAFAGGWVWPIFANYGIIRTNRESAGRATGITQTGVYLGVFSGPLLSGWLIETSGYPAMWFTMAASALVGAVLCLTVADRF